MKTKITACIVVALILLSGLSQAQQRNRANRMQKANTQLTDAQKQELRAAKVEFAKATVDVRNELNELKAYQKTLMSAEKLDENKVFENIDKMTALQKQLMKERISMRLTTSDLCDFDQCDFSRKRGNRSGMRSRGMKQGKGKMMRTNGKCISANNKNRCVNRLGLSEKQQEQMTKVKLDNRKLCENLREELQVLRLKQKHLLNDEEPNKNKIFSNLDRISSIQNELAKKRVLNQKEIRKIFDEDQLVLFLAKPGKMKNKRKARMHRAF